MADVSVPREYLNALELMAAFDFEENGIEVGDYLGARAVVVDRTRRGAPYAFGREEKWHACCHQCTFEQVHDSEERAGMMARTHGLVEGHDTDYGRVA